jgi:hypothetical protein
MHLTKLSRSLDVDLGDTVTNTDHMEHMVYKCMVRLGISLAHFSKAGKPRT